MLQTSRIVRCDRIFLDRTYLVRVLMICSYFSYNYSVIIIGMGESVPITKWSPNKQTNAPMYDQHTSMQQRCIPNGSGNPSNWHFWQHIISASLCSKRIPESCETGRDTIAQKDSPRRDARPRRGTWARFEDGNYVGSTLYQKTQYAKRAQLVWYRFCVGHML